MPTDETETTEAALQRMAGKVARAEVLLHRFEGVRRAKRSTETEFAINVLRHVLYGRSEAPDA